MPDTETLLNQSKAMLDQTKAEGSTPFAGSSFQKSLSSSDLAPATPATVTPPPPSTQGPALQGIIQSGTDDFTKSLEESRKTAEKAMQGTRTSYEDFLKSLRGETGLTAEAYSQKGGVDEVQGELNNINQQIRAEQRALENVTRNIEEKGGGLQSGAQAEVRNATRESLRTQADLYVIQQGVQGRYDSAKAIADRAVSAYLEDQRLELDALKFNYEENKDLFTTAEQREFDVMYADRQRKLDREDTELKAISDLSLEALREGASAQTVAQMRSAKTLAEAINIGGGYIGATARAKAASDSTELNLKRRMDLLELAKEGDPLAIEELGWDPNDPTAKTKIDIQDQITKMDAEIAKVDSMLSNTSGLGAAAGVFRSPAISSLAESASAGPLAPAVAAVKYGEIRDAKADFLSKANYTAATLTAEKVKQLKTEGISFTPMTDRDVELIGKATAELAGYNAIKDENGTIVGFRSEEVARQNLEEVNKILGDVRAREARKLLDDEEIAELESQ